jgi:hypothetical protein
MPAIISDQFRVLNAETFVKSLIGIGQTFNKYYTFIGQPNSTDSRAGGSSVWGSGPSPLDNFKEENDIKDTIIAMKQITTDDVRRMIRKVSWTAGTTYEMYRHDYSIYNKTPITKQSSLYQSNYYVINDDLRVYICLSNGSNPENPNGKPSYDQPTFIDLEPRIAGTSGDEYIWKYLYTIKPSEIVKFDSIEYIPVPENWGTGGESISTKANAVNGKINSVVIKKRGIAYNPTSSTFTNIPILGDGTGGKVTITTDSFGKVSEVYITDGGQNYTYGTIQFYPSAPGITDSLTNSGVGTDSFASFDVIIPPKGGHGYDIYRELGAYRVLVYSRYETLDSNPDVITGNDFSRVGIVKNPTISGSNVELLNTSLVSGTNALKLKIVDPNTVTTYAVDSTITQTIGTGSTAIAFVASWDNVTGVLKYYQPVGLATYGVGYKLNEFTSSPLTGGNLTITGSSMNGTTPLVIDNSFNGVAISTYNRTYQLGMTFKSGIATAEYNKRSGEIIYIDNRAPIPRSSSQKEDIKIILEF